MVFLLAYCISLLCRTKVINQIYSGHSLGRSRHLYTPPPGSVPGFHCPGLNAVSRMPSAVVKGFIISSIRQTQICPIDYLDLLYIMHKLNSHTCANVLNTAMSAFFRSVCSCSAYISTILCTFHAVITPAFPSLEVPERPCIYPRSAVLSVVVCPAAVLLELVPFLPCRKLLLQQISSWHLCRLDC